MLKGKKILLGVCGSIAAYKSALLVRLLVKEGAEVQVVQTLSSTDFITPLTLSTLSKKPVFIDFIKNKNGEWVNHVELGLWADLILIAPASANTIAKMASGQCDNLLTAIYLSAKCPVMVAPAMDRDMYQHPATTRNLQTINQYGNLIIEAEDGELASGLVGVGRMAEPENILQELHSFFSSKNILSGKKVLITSGPTHEALDPVRYISNHSTGKMGLALAEEAAAQGAEVVLVTGPTHLSTSTTRIRKVMVTSAEEMYHACALEFPHADIAIFAAAVADYKPAEIASQKIKKNDGELTITLVKNKDIALEMGRLKRKGQITVGFALETENEESNALKKLDKKNLDLLVLNSLNNAGAGFAHDTNKITIFSKGNKRRDFELKSKKTVATDIIHSITELL